MPHPILWLITLMLVAPLDTRADDETDAGSPMRASERTLKGEDAKRGADLQKRIEAAEEADKYDEAIRFAEELLTLRTMVQGTDHWETVNQRWDVERARKLGARLR